MTVFRINLIRDRPVPLPQRKSVALPLLLYLLAAGVLLAWSVNQAVRDVLSVRQDRRQSDAAYAQFIQQRPRQPDLVSYVTVMRNHLVKADETLSAAVRLLERRTPCATLLYALTAPLPRNVRLLNLDMTPSDGSLRFELAVPVERESDQTDTAKLLSIWNSSPELLNLVSNVREESSQQAEFDGKPSFLIRFAATVKGGG
jgi:hypothetical protein